MPKKKNEEIEETTVETTETAAVEETVETAAAEEAAPVTEETVEATVEATADEPAAEVAVEAEAPVAEEKPAKAKKAAPKATVKAKPAKKDDSVETVTAKKSGKRAEKVGIVSSDKMMKTVTVRVDRLVKHPIYRKYVRKRKKFMAHDETGAKIGDKVRIVETRPLSARKRWRVVEIIQKAQS